MGRAKHTGRVNDNAQGLKLRFDTFKAETLPTIEYFKSKGKCVEIDTKQGRKTFYSLVQDDLVEYTEREFAAKPLTERAELLLALRSYSS